MIAGEKGERTRAPWSGVEIRHLAAVAAIAREGSFSGAAESLGYVQSAVSQQVVQLERLVGARLVERARGTSDVALTEAGEVLLEHGQAMLERLDRAHVELAALAAGVAGRLRLGIFHSAASSLLPLTLPAFASRYPGVEVNITEAASDIPLFESLAQGRVDVAFCELPAVEGAFDSVRLLRDPFVLLAPAEWTLSGLEPVASLSRLKKIPLVGYKESRGQERVAKVLRVHGVEPQFVFRSSLTVAIQRFVASGAGAAIVPRLTVDEPLSGTRLIELPGLPARTIGLAWHAKREVQPAVAAFVEVARSVPF